ncbi:MAG: glutaredoxin family protein [Smithella sp.]
MKNIFLPLLIFFFLFQGISSAEYYKWEDENGNVNITDYPPPVKSAKNIKVHESENKADNQSSSPENNQKQSGKQSSGNAKAEAKKSNEVILYITSWCPYCKMAADFFRSRNIPFTEYDIEKDRAAAERKKQLDSKSGVPFAIINGQPIHGYSPGAYEKALQ